MMKEESISNLIDTQYWEYSRYVLESRAIPSVLDGFKPVQRRALWVARSLAKNGLVKVSKLAGSAMSLHPHGNTSIESAISGMAQDFASANNVCWFEGKGAFGSRIAGPGNGIGAARYVSVRLPQRFHDIIETDSNLIEMKPNYDDTEQEPVAFLPMVPNILLNPIQGIAIGFACNILPRKYEDVVKCQLAHLNGKGFRAPKVHYEGFKGTIEHVEDDTWKSIGVFEQKTKKKIIITELPIGFNRESYIKHLDTLEEKELITSYTDECTDEFLFTVNLKKEMTEEDIITKFKLTTLLHENITVVDFKGKIRKMTSSEIIKEYTDYRFKFYLKRFKKMGNHDKAEYEFKRDLLKVITTGMFKKFPTLKKDEIKKLLIENDIKDVNIPKILQVPIYRFGNDEVAKLKAELAELKKKIQLLVQLCKDESLRKDEYIKELKKLKV